MSANIENTIFPCPFSKQYGMPEGQAWLLLSVYYCYRFILVCALLAGFYLRVKSLPALGTLNNHLYLYASLSYLATTIFLGFLIFWRVLSYSTLAQLLIFTDIIVLTILMYASGGLSSGLGILPAISIAAGGLLIGGRCALVFAAIATVFVLSAEMFSADINELADAQFTQAGFLGATYFAIALLSMVLASRSEQMLHITREQQHTIIKLEELNRYIIQHLQSGIIITDNHQEVHMVNQSATRLAHLSGNPKQLTDISIDLSSAFQNWLTKSGQDMVLLEFPDSVEIQCRFMVLPTLQQLFFMIILEDVALYNQRVQQSKLASLGRLTASIAHEIRNPLSAVSHAGQLLAESTQLNEQDIRLTTIIQTNALRVNEIIEDILSVSRRSDSAREKINLECWIKNYLDGFYIENASHEKTFHTEIDEDLKEAFIDPGHLKQIMDNLCQNAIRYGLPELGCILIRLKNDDRGPCIEVIDNGPGISNFHKKQLFEPFFTTSPKGTGLGLYISKELAELNQAKLGYYFTDKNQSCFSLCLQDANQTTIEI